MLNTPTAHMCDTCLKLFLYNDELEPKDHFRLLPFYDEASVHLEKLKERSELLENTERQAPKVECKQERDTATEELEADEENLFVEDMMGEEDDDGDEMDDDDEEEEILLI